MYIEILIYCTIRSFECYYSGSTNTPTCIISSSTTGNNLQLMALYASNPQMSDLSSLSSCTDADKAGTQTYTKSDANGCAVRVPYCCFNSSHAVWFLSNFGYAPWSIHVRKFYCGYSRKITQSEINSVY